MSFAIINVVVGMKCVVPEVYIFYEATFDSMPAYLEIVLKIS